MVQAQASHSKKRTGALDECEVWLEAGLWDMRAAWVQTKCLCRWGVSQGGGTTSGSVQSRHQA